MSTTLVYGAGPTSITLPDDLFWSDEYLWRAVEQRKTYSITGALLIESGLKAAGQPITLVSGDGAAWVTRTVLDTIQTAARIAGQQLTLNYRGTAYTVMFDHENGAVESQPVVDFSDPIGGDFHTLTLRFIKV